MLDGLRTSLTLSEAQGSWGHGPVHEYGSHHVCSGMLVARRPRPQRAKKEN